MNYIERTWPTTANIHRRDLVSAVQIKSILCRLSSLVFGLFAICIGNSGLYINPQSTRRYLAFQHEARVKARETGIASVSLSVKWWSRMKTSGRRSTKCLDLSGKNNLAISLNNKKYIYMYSLPSLQAPECQMSRVMDANDATSKVH